MADTDKNKIELNPAKASSNKYKGTPVPSPLVIAGKHLPAFLIDGDVMPKLGDNIIVMFRGQTFTGRCKAILKGNIVALAN